MRFGYIIVEDVFISNLEDSYKLDIGEGVV